MKQKLVCTALLLASVIFTTQAQFGLGKKKKDDAKGDTATTAAAPQEEEKKKGGGGFFQKVISKVAKSAAKMGGAMTGTTTATSDLSAIEPYMLFNSNLLPKEVGTMEMDFINGYKQGGDMVGIMLLPKDKSFFYKLDGTVKIDGKEADYQSTGLYTKVFDGSANPRTIEMETRDGKKAKFTLIPRKNVIKLASINNKKDGAEIDMTRDFTMQLENFSTKPNAMVRVRIVAQTIGLRGFYDVGTFKAGSNITVPGYILKHLNTTNKGMNFKNSYLAVDDAEVQEAKDEAGSYSTPLKYSVASTSALPVKIVNESSLFMGLTATADDKLPAGKISYSFNKPNAYSSRPFEQVKIIAPTTMSISGTTYYYDEKDNKFLNIKNTKEIEFPQIPDAKLNGLLEKMYSQLTKILQDQFGATILSPEKVTATNAYKQIDVFANKDVNTTSHFSKSYKGLNELTNVIPLASTFSGESALFAATGANALLKASLNLQISFDGDPILKPILKVELLGDKNGGETGLFATKYFTSEIKGQGYKIKKEEVTDEVINNIVRVDDLMMMFKKGLQDIVAKEKQHGEYAPIWNLQK